ncbi:MAG: substrate-binding domain-containing protein [Planctomycetota bacterium]|jgi:DNA-binding LacI/PurR family transcriptional regulator|nr:substrate-binding domain-containing protein [Planctomycetota bacterium]
MSQEQLYVRVATDLRRRIRDGELALGAKLPGRALLAKEYGVALPTMERAMGQLLAAGEVVAQRRKGTVVARIPDAPMQAQAQQRARPLRLGLMAPAPPDDLDPRRIRDPRIATMIQGMERTLADTGGELLFRNLFKLARELGDHVTAVEHAAKELIATGAEALCLANPYAQAELEDAARALATTTTTPFCYASTRPLRLTGAQVLMALDEGATMAAEHLLARGYTRIAYLAPWRAEWITARARLAQRAIGTRAHWHQVVHDHDTVHLRDQQGAVAARAVTQARVDIPDLLTGGANPWGLLCPSEVIACQALDALEATGGQAGRDLGIIALDEGADAFMRGLSVISPPLTELGAAAVHAAAAEAGIRTVHPRLVARASTRRA